MCVCESASGLRQMMMSLHMICRLDSFFFCNPPTTTETLACVFFSAIIRFTADSRRISLNKYIQLTHKQCEKDWKFTHHPPLALECHPSPSSVSCNLISVANSKPRMMMPVELAFIYNSTSSSYDDTRFPVYVGDLRISVREEEVPTEADGANWMPTKRFDFAARIPLFPPFTTLDLREQASRSSRKEPSSTIGIRSTGIGDDGMIWEGDMFGFANKYRSPSLASTGGRWCADAYVKF